MTPFRTSVSKTNDSVTKQNMWRLKGTHQIYSLEHKVSFQCLDTNDSENDVDDGRYTKMCTSNSLPSESASECCIN